MGDMKIKNCPFCGGKSRVHKYFSKYYARCNKCNTYSAPYNTPEEAAEAWNTRTTDEPQKNTTHIDLCDREANAECTKFYCVDNGGECECTLNIRFAKKDNDGNPIISYMKEGDL